MRLPVPVIPRKYIALNGNLCSSNPGVKRDLFVFIRHREEFWLMPNLLEHKVSVGFQSDGAPLHFHDEVIKFLSLLWFGWLAAGLSPWIFGFSPRPVHMGFFVGQSGTGVALLV
jgi:hypothetical protein